MTDPLEADLHLLVEPGPDTPVIPAHLVIARRAHLNGRYGDPVWSLAPLIDDPSSVLYRIPWASCPDGFRDELRLITWTFLNGELPNTFVRARGRRMRTRLAASPTLATVVVWRQLALWLHERGVRSLAACDRAQLDQYAAHLRETITLRATMSHTLTALTRLWAFDRLSASPTGIARPPWDEDGLDDYLPAASARGAENGREPLAEDVMGPLLIWALRLTEDLADDIIGAQREKLRLCAAALTQASTPTGWEALHAHLAPLLSAGRPLPSVRWRGKPALARSYLAGTSGASLQQVQKAYQRFGLAERVAADPGPCPLNVPVTGVIAGRPWRTAVDYTETATLLRHLVTAAFIVCAHLTGARPQEVLAMRSGCCPDPGPGQGRPLLLIRTEDLPGETDDCDTEESHLLIRSRHFKTATDPDTGLYLPGGAERAVPWVAIAPVVNAIRVLERLVPDGALLFDAAVHDPARAATRSGSLGSEALRERIDDFVTWVNIEALRQDLPGEAIPPDPHGRIGTARFRRTLAWHIARRPGGLVALAIQYGHMRTALNTDESGRYGTRSRGGIHQLVDIETGLATADTAADLAERFHDGEGVSGPAARRALLQATTGPLFQGGLVKRDFPVKHELARRHLARDGSVLFDNPHALLLCLYRRDRALCRGDEQLTAPVLDRCVPGCGNIVRTDQQAADLRQRAEHMERKAALLPEPIGERLRTNASRLRTWADDQDRTRATAKESPA
ncbi:hypothetical protein ABIA32_006685 [Streptacidiphilus sp. MAP12-20]|uniref:integrase n=1 Tax=Streptacidiphilus sp. MAP12-20 TaxID=3156299 RepID=UPI003515D86C